MRIVLDTNVLMSGIFFSGIPAYQNTRQKLNGFRTLALGNCQLRLQLALHALRGGDGGRYRT